MSSVLKPSEAETKKGVIVPLSSASDNSHKVSGNEFSAEMFDILSQLSYDLGLIQKYAAQNQSDWTTIYKEISDNTQTQTQNYLQKLQEQKEAEARAKRGVRGFFHHAFKTLFGNKYATLALTCVIGALFCETPLGAAFLITTIALQGTGVMDKMTHGTAKGINWVSDKTLGTHNDKWSELIASVLITIVLTKGASKAEAAGAVKGSEMAAAKETETVATKEAEVEAAKSGEQTAAKEASSTEETACKKPSRFNVGVAAAGTFSASLFGTNFGYNLLNLCGVDEEKAKFYGMIINTILSAIAMIAAMYSGPEKSAADESKGFLAKGLKYARSFMSFAGFLPVAGVAYLNIDTGLQQKEQGKLQKEIAPFLADITKLTGLINMVSLNISQAQKTYESTANTKGLIFDTDFSIGWKTVIQA